MLGSRRSVDVIDAIKNRRSIRKFKSRDVSDEIMLELIDAAHWAPSAGNIQPWDFIIVREPEIKRRLAEAALKQTFIQQAPVVIVVCASEDRSSIGYGMRGKTLYCVQDTAAAIQNINLAAYSLGLGTCWVGAFKEEEVREVLEIPRGKRPVAVIPVGYPAQSPTPRRRRPVDDLIHHEKF